jgi:hypothetical protein
MGSSIPPARGSILLDQIRVVERPRSHEILLDRIRIVERLSFECP